jgi:hypothetical protein
MLFFKQQSLICKLFQQLISKWPCSQLITLVYTWRFKYSPGLPDGFFHTKNPYLGKFWRALEWTMLVCFMTFWNILRPFGKHNLWPFGIVFGNLSFGIFFPFWFVWTKKNLATLVFTLIRHNIFFALFRPN